MNSVIIANTGVTGIGEETWIKDYRHREHPSDNKK